MFNISLLCARTSAITPQISRGVILMISGGEEVRQSVGIAHR